jgi:sulfur-carrier protein adenylyltransferase/sulfurtransferase
MNQPSPTQQGKSYQDLVSEAKSRIHEISADELRQWIAEGKDMILLDVREPEEYANGNIPGAVNIPRGLLELEVDEVVPEHGKTVVAYCGGGGRSALAADTLQVMGYQNVHSLARGFKGWNQQ